MKIINFWIKNINKKIDIDTLKNGNPGIGGTQFEVGLIAYYLNLFYQSDFKIVIYSDSNDLHSENIEIVKVDKFEEIFKKINKNEILIFSNADINPNYYDLIEQSGISSIAWIHNYLIYEHYVRLVKIPNIKRIIFVGQEHYDYYISTKIMEKSVFIFNCVPRFNSVKRNTNENNVMYIGALIKQKGFHILAKAWKGVLKECPDAQLFVLGKGLYGDKNEVDHYIEKCNKYLKDKKGNLLSNIHYMGTLGDKKEELYSITKVGVSNPSGKTETFCLSAAEFEAHKIPVVTFNGYGLLDTVINNKTGIRCKNSRTLCKAIVNLLKNPNNNILYGENGQNYVENTFSAEAILPKWKELLLSDMKPIIEPINFSYKNYWNNFKLLKYCEYKFKSFFKIKKDISITILIMKTRYFVKKILNK